MKKHVFLLMTALVLVSAGAVASSEALEYKNIPLKSQITHVQPMTGIVLWGTGTHALSYADSYAMEYSYFKYSDVVQAKGSYDWSAIDSFLDQAAARGHQGIVRFHDTYVGDHVGGVPQYIRQSPGYEATHALSEGRMTCFPDWRSEELQRFHLEFYARFAAIYDRDPRLAFMQTGFGLWSEYHIYDGPSILGRTFPTKEFQKEVFQKLSTFFEDLSWSVSIDAANEVYSPLSADPELRKLPFGLFDDSFMHKEHHQYNTDCWNFFGRDRYKSLPCGGEFGYYTPFDQQNVLNKEGLHGRTWEDQSRAFHITYMIGNDQPRYQTLERIKEAGMASGYRFAIREFKRKGDLVHVEVKNVGVAPIYRDAFVALDGVRAVKNLRDLMPGESFTIEFHNNSQSPRITIECDHLVAGQTIEFEANIE